MAVQITVTVSSLNTPVRIPWSLKYVTSHPVTLISAHCCPNRKAAEYQKWRSLKKAVSLFPLAADGVVSSRME